MYEENPVKLFGVIHKNNASYNMSGHFPFFP